MVRKKLEPWPCQLTEKGRNSLNATRRQSGLVIGESRDGTCWWIKWDGLLARECLHKSFVEPTTTDKGENE